MLPPHYTIHTHPIRHISYTTNTSYGRITGIYSKERRLCVRKYSQGIDMTEEEREIEYASQRLSSVQLTLRDLHKGTALLAGQLQVELEFDGAPQDFQAGQA